MLYKKIYRKSVLYSILWGYMWVIYRLFYKKISVKGLSNIPQGKPIIFAPNHQNSLLDALILAFTSVRKIIFLARADIFTKKRTAWFLGKLRIMPIFRIRDGIQELQKNDEIFDLCVEVLERKHAMGIFPEATHNDKRSIRPLKKGIARLAFMAEEKNNWNLDLHIVPVGIYFTHYRNFRSSIVVQFGTPIRIADYQQQVVDNEVRATVALTQAMFKGIHPLTIDIRSTKYYWNYERIRKMYSDEMLQKLDFKPTFYNRFRAEQTLIETLETYEKNQSELMTDLHEKVSAYNAGLKELNLKDWTLKKELSLVALVISLIPLLLTFPLFLYGLLNNGIPAKIIENISLKIKDKQFHSSVKYVLGAILYPIFYGIQFLLVHLFTETYCIQWLYLLSLPLTGLVAHYYLKTWTRWTRKFRTYQLRGSKNDKILQLKALRTEIINKIATIIH